MSDLPVKILLAFFLIMNSADSIFPPCGFIILLPVAIESIAADPGIQCF